MHCQTMLICTARHVLPNYVDMYSKVCAVTPLPLEGECTVIKKENKEREWERKGMKRKKIL